MPPRRGFFRMGWVFYKDFAPERGLHTGRRMANGSFKRRRREIALR